MITTDLSTLKIHKLTQEQYEREREAGRLDENAIYLTPDEATDLSGYVTTEQLNSAVDDALSEAKESGEFDGISATHSWNGTILTISSASGTSSANLKGDKGDQGETGPQGEKGEQGEQGIQGLQGEQGEKGADGAKGDKGDTGEAGYSPVRGTDYWTEADKAEIKAYVDEAILNGAW